jgi:hypothetical protein
LFIGLNVIPIINANNINKNDNEIEINFQGKLMMLLKRNQFACSFSICWEIVNNGDDIFYFKRISKFYSLNWHINNSLDNKEYSLKPGKSICVALATKDFGKFNITITLVGQGEDEGVIVSKTAMGIWIYKYAIILNQYYN